MAPKIRQLSDFLERLRKEGSTRFTWLIGAGMSASAGIPTAQGVSQRIIIFEYLISINKRPWDNLSKGCITYQNDLADYFCWYEELERQNSNEFKKLFENAINWLKNYDEEYRDITIDSTLCYPLLFKKCMQSRTTYHNFLTLLVNRAKSVNLAHLALAGILRDHPDWGHTVFTTNFDDLMLKAIFNLNHTARVFGDVTSYEQPSTTPDYPQIVHLHGRHTGYRLLNTKNEMSKQNLDDPDMREGFTKHLKETELIVIGYSGWDDLVMKTLGSWVNDSTLLRGNLYWVPYKNNDTIIDQTQKFFENCPSEQVHIIVNDEGTLNADSFMLALCDVINQENKGFAPYRQGIINHAKYQHDFALSQLRDHPDFDPNQALDIIKKAKESIKKGNLEEAIHLKVLAEDRIYGDDMHDELHGQIFLDVGIVELLLENLDSAKINLNKALSIWTVDKLDNKGSVVSKKADTLRALGEVYLKLGDIENAERHVGRALSRYKDIDDQSGIGFTNKLLCDIAMRKGQLEKAKNFIEKSVLAFNNINNIYGKAICYRSLGEIYRIEGKDDLANDEYGKAWKLFVEIDDPIGIANSIKGTVNYYIRQGDYIKAEEMINDATVIYKTQGDSIGVANMENILGDFYMHKEYFPVAIEKYRKSLNYYCDIGASHGIANALADLLICYTKQSTYVDIKPIHNYLYDVANSSGNAYALNILKTYTRPTV